MAPKLRRSRRRTAAGASTPLPPPSTDVFFEILSWLPLRPLSRSRCVCTSWRALISEPAFVAVHRSRVEPLLVAATYSADIGTDTTSTLKIMDTEGDVARLVDLDDFWKFRASLDSLVLLTSRPEFHSPDVRVIDLATGETIASCPGPAVDDRVSRLTTKFGFGRAARSGALKVVRIISYFLSPRHRLTCQVLMLADNGGSGWRRTRSPRDFFRDSNEGVTVNGVLHFRSIYQDNILCFDLESEEWTAIHGPTLGTLSPWEKIGLAALNGVLCITHAKQHTVNLWLLTNLDKEDVWVKAYTISMDHALDFVP